MWLFAAGASKMKVTEFRSIDSTSNMYWNCFVLVCEREGRGGDENEEGWKRSHPAISGSCLVSGRLSALLGLLVANVCKFVNNIYICQTHVIRSAELHEWNSGLLCTLSGLSLGFELRISTIDNFAKICFRFPGILVRTPQSACWWFLVLDRR